MSAGSLDEVVLPRSLDAERAVIGAMILDNEVIDEVHGIVKPFHFFDQRNKILYEAVLNLRDRFQAVDILTLRNELERKSEEKNEDRTLLEITVDLPISRR